MAARNPIRQREQIRTHIDTLDTLAAHLQWAVTLKLSMIPPYLCALYSIKDSSSTAYRLLKSAAVEQMLHLMVASNLMNSIGTPPVLSGEYVPKFPGVAPFHPAGGPFLQLQAFSSDFAESIISKTLADSASQINEHDSRYTNIVEFYQAIADGFIRLAAEHGEAWVFSNDTGFQRSDAYFGGGANHLTPVASINDALKAVACIAGRGEAGKSGSPGFSGAHADQTVPTKRAAEADLVSMMAAGSQNDFSQQLIGLAALATNETAVYPMRTNPRSEELRAEFRELSDLFNMCYTLVLRALELGLGSSPEGFNFLGVAFPVMHFALPALSTLLMQTPIERHGDLKRGPTAGPAFQYFSAPLAHLIRLTRLLLNVDPQCGKNVEQAQQYQQLWTGTLSLVLDVLKSVKEELDRANEDRL